jgi:hypothetical protein
MSRGGQNRIDLTGRRFGRLVVVEYSETRGKLAFWLCKCDCGNEKIISRSSLRTGNSNSCGCLQKELTTQRNFRHGYSFRGCKGKHYIAWASMMARCYCGSSEDFYLYGERGISVCEEWHDPVNYINWRKSKEPVPKGYSVDRIDVNGNYCPENCRFASATTQSRNRRPFSEWRIK